MSVKCPACGFESPEGSGWCDFCKEPFNRKRPEAAPPPEAAAVPAPAPPSAPVPGPESAPAVEPGAIPPEVLQKLCLTPEAMESLLKAEAGKGIPTAPPYLRQLAWLFFAACVMALIALLTVMSNRAKELEDAPPLAGSGPGKSLTLHGGLQREGQRGQGHRGPERGPY